MPDWATYVLPAASFAASITIPWLAIGRARSHFEGVVDTKFKAIDERLASQDRATEKAFEGMNAPIKEALARLYAHERELGGIAATINGRGYSGSGR